MTTHSPLGMRARRRRGSPASARGRLSIFAGAVLGLVAALLLLAAPAAVAGAALDRAAAQLSEQAPLYIDPSMSDALGSQEAEIRSKMAAVGTPVYVAALPQSEVDDAGSGGALVQRLARAAKRHGTYLAVTPRGLFAISDVLDDASVIETTRTAARENRSAGPALVQALDGIAGLSVSGGDSPAENSGGGPTNDGSSGGGSGGGLAPLLILGLVGGGGALFVSRSRRRRVAQQSQENLAEVRTAAAEDVTRFGEDITALDLDVDSPGVDDDTRKDYAAALDAYDTAKRSLDQARTTNDLAAVSTALEDGRYSMECVRARMAGRPLPDRRMPCFFNPQHGPSVQDVEWAPPGGQPRPVPACAADAERVLRGDEPESRQVVVAGQRRPYWEAGPAYAPWAGGYYRGGMGMGGILPGILIGTVLGGAMNPGWGFPGGYGDGNDGNDGGFGGGGGDFGGFGGGGGDFGGGGGDFGGGGGDFGGGD